MQGPKKHISTGATHTAHSILFGLRESSETSCNSRGIAPQGTRKRISTGSSSHSRGTSSARAPFVAPGKSANAARLAALRIAAAQAEKAAAEAASKLAYEQLAAELALQSDCEGDSNGAAGGSGGDSGDAFNGNAVNGNGFEDNRGHDAPFDPMDDVISDSCVKGGGNDGRGTRMEPSHSETPTESQRQRSVAAPSPASEKMGQQRVAAQSALKTPGKAMVFSRGRKSNQNAGPQTAARGSPYSFPEAACGTEAMPAGTGDMTAGLCSVYSFPEAVHGSKDSANAEQMIHGSCEREARIDTTADTGGGSRRQQQPPAQMNMRAGTEGMPTGTEGMPAGTGEVPAGAEGGSRRRPSARSLAQNASQPLQITVETPFGFKALVSPNIAEHSGSAALRYGSMIVCI